MKVLLDEMFSGIKPFLTLLGWDVVTVEDAGLKGAKDEDIVRYAKENGLLLVTQEQRVADMARLLGVPAVVVSLADMAKLIDEKIREFERSGTSRP